METQLPKCQVECIVLNHRGLDILTSTQAKYTKLKTITLTQKIIDAEKKTTQYEFVILNNNSKPETLFISSLNNLRSIDKKFLSEGKMTLMFKDSNAKLSNLLLKSDISLKESISKNTDLSILISKGNPKQLEIFIEKIVFFLKNNSSSFAKTPAQNTVSSNQTLLSAPPKSLSQAANQKNVNQNMNATILKRSLNDHHQAKQQIKKVNSCPSSQNNLIQFNILAMLSDDLVRVVQSYLDKMTNDELSFANKYLHDLSMKDRKSLIFLSEISKDISSESLFRLLMKSARIEHLSLGSLRKVKDGDWTNVNLPFYPFLRKLDFRYFFQLNSTILKKFLYSAKGIIEILLPFKSRIGEDTLRMIPSLLKAEVQFFSLKYAYNIPYIANQFNLNENSCSKILCSYSNYLRKINLFLCSAHIIPINMCNLKSIKITHLIMRTFDDYEPLLKILTEPNLEEIYIGDCIQKNSQSIDHGGFCQMITQMKFNHIKSLGFGLIANSNLFEILQQKSFDSLVKFRVHSPNVYDNDLEHLLEICYCLQYLDIRDSNYVSGQCVESIVSPDIKILKTKLSEININCLQNLISKQFNSNKISIINCK